MRPLTDTTDFREGEWVVYVPYHANGDRKHPDCEIGQVTSRNEKFVFARFIRRGIQQATPEACMPDQLVRR